MCVGQQRTRSLDLRVLCSRARHRCTGRIPLPPAARGRAGRVGCLRFRARESCPIVFRLAGEKDRRGHSHMLIPMPTVVGRWRRTNYFSLINNACLREQELVQPAGIGAESANAFGEFVGGHGVLVQGQSKAGLVVVQLRLVRPGWV